MVCDMWYDTDKCPKCYHSAQKPVRALGWKAAAALVSLISHPSLILSRSDVAPCSSAALPVLLLGSLGRGLWARSYCACPDGLSCSSHSLGVGWGSSQGLEPAGGSSHN